MVCYIGHLSVVTNMAKKMNKFIIIELFIILLCIYTACELNCNYPKGQQNLECTKCVCTTNSFQGINCNGKRDKRKANIIFLLS